VSNTKGSRVGEDLVEAFNEMAAYPKNERDDLSSAQRKAILAAIESIKGG
jgi:hypothetical protein